MNQEHENEKARAKSNLENLREDLARHIRERDQANTIIELRTADVARAERYLEQCRYPAYDRHGGVARRIICVDKKYIYMRNDVGRRDTFRRSDGAPKRTKQAYAAAGHHGKVDDNRAVLLWNDFVESLAQDRVAARAAKLAAEAQAAQA